VCWCNECTCRQVGHCSLAARVLDIHRYPTSHWQGKRSLYVLVHPCPMCFPLDELPDVFGKNSSTARASLNVRGRLPAAEIG
jgi:hypothetical protein